MSNRPSQPLLERLHDEEDYPAHHPPLSTCAGCLRQIPEDEQRLLCFLGARDGSAIRVTRVCMECAREEQTMLAASNEKESHGNER